MAKKRRPELDRAAVFESILGDLGEEANEASLGAVPIDEVRFNRKQPRKYIDEAGLDDLAASIRDKGVLEPIIVRRAADGYELVAGERRTRAAQRVGLTEIPAIVVEIDDREALEVSIMENLQREDLNAVEETEAVLALLGLTLDIERPDVLHLLQELYAEERGRSPASDFSPRQKQAAQHLFRRLGRFTPASFVVNRVPILDFPEELLDAVRSGKLAFTKAQAIVRVEDEGARERLLAEAVAQEMTLSQIRRRITELRREDDDGRAGPGEQTWALAGSAKRLLSRRRLASLDRRSLDRVTALLEELQSLLER